VSPTGLLVDLDGVLVNSLAAVIRAWTWWAPRHGLDPTPFINAHGRTTREAIAELAPRLDPDLEAASVEDRQMIDTAGVVALPGAMALLTLEQPLAIVTSSTRPVGLARLRAAGLAIPKVLISAESVGRGKPDPEPCLLAAARLGLAPTDCIVFDDSPAGIQCGKAAGMTVVGVVTTVGPSALEGADLIVRDLSEYLQLAHALPTDR
jgi:sugar-phosphatase